MLAWPFGYRAERHRPFPRMPAARFLPTLFVLLAALPLAPQAQTAAAPGWTWNLDGAVQGAFNRDPFWGLAQTFAPQAGYGRTVYWLETYLRAGGRGEQALDPATTVYGGVSLLGTATLGEDVFQQSDSGRVRVEDAYVGLRRTLSGGTRIDLSGGAQSYRLGEGLLIAVGGGNGFERGAITLAPRRAWAMTGLARVQAGETTVEAFYLDPNELESSDSGTTLGGARAEWSPSRTTVVGITAFEVLRSSTPYPQAPATILDSGRDGLRTYGTHARWAPQSGPLAGLSVSGEAAIQRNGRIALKAAGFGADVGYRFAGLPLQPRISWSPRWFSGDDPGTSGRLERFDPLFYDSAPATWSSGGNGSLAFYNSNLLVHRLRVDLTLSPRDFVNLNYWNVRAAQANSPIQYGQAARIGVSGNSLVLLTGVPDRALTQEFYVEYTRVLTPRWFLTSGLAVAVPDAGLDALVPGGARTWVGALVNLSFRY